MGRKAGGTPGAGHLFLGSARCEDGVEGVLLLAALPHVADGQLIRRSDSWLLPLGLLEVQHGPDARVHPNLPLHHHISNSQISLPALLSLPSRLLETGLTQSGEKGEAKYTGSNTMFIRTELRT